MRPICRYEKYKNLSPKRSSSESYWRSPISRGTLYPQYQVGLEALHHLTLYDGRATLSGSVYANSLIKSTWAYYPFHKLSYFRDQIAIADASTFLSSYCKTLRNEISNPITLKCGETLAEKFDILHFLITLISSYFLCIK